MNSNLLTEKKIILILSIRHFLETCYQKQKLSKSDYHGWVLSNDCPHRQYPQSLWTAGPLQAWVSMKWLLKTHSQGTPHGPMHTPSKKWKSDKMHSSITNYALWSRITWTVNFVSTLPFFSCHTCISVFL